MSQRRWVITWGAFISMGFLGMSRSFLGASLPAIRTTLEMTLIQAGTLGALLQLGFSIMVLLGGPISDTLKKSLVLMLGLFLLGISLIFFGLAHWFWVSLVATTVVGIGGGLIEASSNPLLVELYPGRESTVMNLHHFFFAVGSLVGPLIVGALLARSISWQWGYIGYGLTVLFVLLLLLSQRISSPATGHPLDLRTLLKLMRQKTFLSLVFIIFCSAGAQSGLIYWTVTFLKETHGFSISLASLSLSLFLVCLAVGRLFAGYLLTKLNDTLYLVILFSLLLIFLSASIYAPAAWVIPLLGACGLAMAGVFPTLLGMAGKAHPEKPGTAMGLIATAAGLGSTVIPWLMSLVSQLSTLRHGFLLFEVALAISLIITCFNFRRLKRSADVLKTR
jgi:FHS family glucose/mannose:H+ symporter-like MFS transporter